MPSSTVARLLGRLLGRLLVPAAAILLAVVVLRGFEVHDETVQSPTRRPVRLTATSEPGTAIEYVEGYEAGLRRATAEDRPMLVIFRAAWCRWCAELAQGPLLDQRLVRLSRQFVCVGVDADRHADDCRRFGVKQFPTVILATSAGEEIRRWTGCPTADELATAMTGVASVARLAELDDDDTPAPR
ncbi:MAG: thioredoxin domain-containing protein [Planctomycetia bacterium]